MQVTDIQGGGGGTGGDQGDSAATALSVLVPSTNAGTIDPGTDVDWFRFSAVGATQYTFETSLGTLPDSRLELFDANGVSLAENDDIGGGNRASKIIWTSPGSGTYYLRVRPFGTYQTGTYTLSLSGGGGTSTPTLTVDVLQTSISEPNGTAQATVTRNTGTSGTLTVNLSSSDTSEANVSTPVTIFDGFNSATFTVSAQDDTLADGADGDDLGYRVGFHRRQ